MKTLTILALTLLAYIAPGFAAPGSDFTIKKLDVDYPASPDLGGAPGAAPGARWTPQKWVRMEVTFDALPEMTEELQFNYYVLAVDRPGPDRLMVGRVNYVNIAKGNGLHAVMYIPPQALLRFSSTHKPVNIQNFLAQVTVTISKPGAPAALAIGHLKIGGHGEWWTTMKAEEGFLVNKSETPFAPFGWDYYEALKSASAH